MPRKRPRSGNSTKSGKSEPNVQSTLVKLPAERTKSAEEKDRTNGLRTMAEAGAPAVAELPQKGFPIVGIGASAGGLEALVDLFGEMPVDTGMAFVVVTHQHPGHTSMLPELLRRGTGIPVFEARDGLTVEPNHIYVGPPGGHLSILNGTLHLMDTGLQEAPRLPIDYFFRALASDQKERAICIVLSGTGTDGTVGLRAIKAESGMAMAQQPQSAKYSGMPSSAIATGLADYVLPPAGMPQQLMVYAKGPYLTALPIHPEVATVPPQPLQKIFILLRNRTGHDFSAYKTSTIHRRIERRMNVHQIKTPSDYVRFLQENPRELDILFKELLISVTNFFRDPDAWTALIPHIEDLLKLRPEGYTFRFWVPGCATGEEAYTLAIVFRECLDKVNRHQTVQIFGTDLDPQAIDTARAGVYPDGIGVDVSPKRLERFFIREDGTYRIRKEIREMTVFAPQNVIKDPPFTKLDLISCRNLLIYLNSQLQKKLLPIFHYALKPDGVLLLGPSETIGPAVDLFETSDKRWKIYRRKESAMALHTLPEIPAHPLERMETANLLGAAAQHPREIRLSVQLERVLLNRFTPASLVVNERGDILYIHGRTGAYLEPAEGEPRNNILEMVREGLQVELPAAMRECRKKGKDVTREGIRVKNNGGFAYINLTVARIGGPEAIRDLLLITFRPTPPAQPKHLRTKGIPARSRETGRIGQLERELQYTKESHQTTLEELETSNEELKSANEELQSINEELQSTNEELETSKEEMQSLNEELTTVNTELQSKVDELSETNDDMQNLLNSTNIATVFLDNDLNIKRFTTQAKDLVMLRETDVGRPISDLASNLEQNDLGNDCQRVLKTLGTQEAEVSTKTGQWYQMRIMPYRTAENVIDGLVLTFVDINRLKKAEQEVSAVRDGLSNELEAIQRLHEIGASFLRGGQLQPILEKVLDAAVLFTKADMGNIQLLDPETGRLKIRIHKGLSKDWLDYCDAVDQGLGASAASLKIKQRVIIEDVTTSPIFAGSPALDVHLKTGVLAVQSTPIMNRAGEVFGVISTHFKTPQRLNDHALRLLDMLALQTAEIVERTSEVKRSAG
jgi:two-component system CheB/CheR fusion protein